MKIGTKWIVAGGLLASITAGHATAAELAYTYTLTGTNGPVGGATTLGTLLNDGLYSADQASAAVAWDATDGVGVIFNSDLVVTLDLGSVNTIHSILIDYQVWWGAGVPAWESVDIAIDGNFVTTFSDFPVDMTDDSDYQRVAVLPGTNTGQVIELTFDRANNIGGSEEWGPLSEIDVHDSPIPEPGSLALLGLGGLLIARRRRA